MVTYFKYLGSVLNVSGDYWPEVVNNLRYSRSKWARFSIILGREGADAWTSGTF